MKFRVLALLNLNKRIVKLFDQLTGNKDITPKMTIDDYYSVLYAYTNLNLHQKLPDVVETIKKRFNTAIEDTLMLDDLSRRLKRFATNKSIVTNPDSSLPINFSPNIFLVLTLYKNQFRFTEAASILKKMIAREKNQQAPYLELCDIYLKQKQYNKARKYLATMNKRFPGSSTVKNFHAYFLALQGKDLEKALELSTETLLEDKDNPAYIDTYGYILFKLGRLEKAGTFLKKAYDKHPFEPEIMEHLAEWYRLNKETGKVLEIYRKAVEKRR